MLRTSDWQYRIPDHTGDEFTFIKFWSYSPRELRDHEDAAEAVAESLTRDDPAYYPTLEDKGVEMDIQSPDGEIKTMRAGGFTKFVYTAEEV